MKLSVIVPAFNEEKLLPHTLDEIRRAVQPFLGTELEYELIVANNNSTDRTAEIAARAGARVVFEPIRQIARSRNAGAAAASGEWLLFIDADSYPSAALIGAMLEKIRSGRHIGGGSTVSARGFPLSARLWLRLWNAISRTCRWAAGSFIFCRTDAFRAAGGFSPELYASEEIDLSRRLKQSGRREGKGFAILTRHPLTTSPRKVELYRLGEILKLLFRIALRPRKMLRSPEGLYLWYDGRR
ncbi:MAG: glycosyltransferase [Planctomycetes bacterium]|nr:glycosyltransferase [Planctomycetota bacterium]